MKEYLGYYSAATFWNIPYIEAVLGSEITSAYPTSFVVPQRRMRSPKQGQTKHLCELTLPPEAVVSKNGTIVASPELLFLQLASKLDIQRLILLGLQLLSHPPGNPELAITTKQNLKTFLSKISGHRGHRKAFRALKYLENGSASIMESIVYMILTLPHILGGYGLDGAVFNHEIKLKEETSKRLGQKRCFADLYYKSARLAVEYESFAFHSSPFDQGKDVLRSAILERQGIEVMRLTTIQLYDKDACMDFAFNLASRLGKRIQIRTKKFDSMHANLRTMLPARNPIDEVE
ncbi:MAG: hypothetical protein ACOX4J_02210 [Anaerovoracaceae bacterium]|jgi:hypothetical protein